MSNKSSIQCMYRHIFLTFSINERAILAVPSGRKATFRLPLSIKAYISLFKMSDCHIQYFLKTKIEKII